MGTVWLARMTGANGFERMLAVKTILPAFSSDRQFCDMFLDEARIASQIDHENVARILDIGEDRGLLYYAMELIDGVSVRKLYRDVRGQNAIFPIGVALRIAADACAGLHATHELRAPNGSSLDVVHRDVSPQNLLITTRGVTKLIDFGVAKASARRTEETAAGTLKGKIEYMAPEQARGQTPDRRADIYALGALLYELLAGYPVRDTEGGRQLLALHELMTGVPPAPLPNHVPDLVASLVGRALAEDPNARFATAEEMRQGLEYAMQATQQVATRDDVARVLVHFSAERMAVQRASMEKALAASSNTRGEAVTVIAPLSAYDPPPGPASGPRLMYNMTGEGAVTGPSMVAVTAPSEEASTSTTTKVVIGAILGVSLAFLMATVGFAVKRREAQRDEALAAAQAQAQAQAQASAALVPVPVASASAAPRSTTGADGADGEPGARAPVARLPGEAPPEPAASSNAAGTSAAGTAATAKHPATAPDGGARPKAPASTTTASPASAPATKPKNPKPAPKDDYGF